MKRLFTFAITFVLLLSLSSCGIFRSSLGNGIPEFLSDVHWEMPSWELEKNHRLVLIHERSFREVYHEQEPTESGVSDIIYYFAVIEGRGDRPLYEIIINFDSEKLRNDFADDHLGEPNTEDGEWEWTLNDEQYRAWTFQSKLIIVKVVPGCEWDS